MSHFAKVENGIVTKVIVAEENFINSGKVGDPSLWIQTSYNTHAGQHPEDRPLRKNFAGIGYSYDSIRDAFIPVKPYESWVLNEDTCLWDPPIPYPNADSNEFYKWNEENQSWYLD